MGDGIYYSISIFIEFPSLKPSITHYEDVRFYYLDIVIILRNVPAIVFYVY